jgi:hypothetical protein
MEYKISVLSYALGPPTPFPVRNGSPPSVFLLPVCIARLHSLVGDLNRFQFEANEKVDKIYFFPEIL